MTAFGGALTDPTKIMGSRVGAYVIDAILTVVVVVGAFFLFGMSRLESIDAGSPAAAQAMCDEVNNQTSGDHICFTSGSTARLATGSDAESIQAILYGSAIAFGIANYVILSTVAGGTLGKLLFGLRVTTAYGKRAGIGRNLVRWLFLIIDGLCCYFLPGLIVASKSKGHRRIGDMVAGTYVVHRSAEGRLLNIPGHLVVKNRQDPYVTAANPPGIGQAPGTAAPATADGISAPVFDPSRNTYVRYDQGSGVWFQWDDRTQSWVPAQQ